MSESIIQRSVFNVLSCPYSSLSSLLVQLFCYSTHHKHPTPLLTQHSHRKIVLWGFEQVIVSALVRRHVKSFKLFIQNASWKQESCPSNEACSRDVSLKGKCFQILHPLACTHVYFHCIYCTGHKTNVHNVSFGVLLFMVTNWLNTTDAFALHCLCTAYWTNAVSWGKWSPILDLFWMDTHTQDTI